MTTIATAIESVAHVERRNLEEAFCLRLSDETLRLAVGSNFDAALLWEQRDQYRDELILNGLFTYQATRH